MAEEWSGVINTTAPRYLKGAIDATIRERLLLSLMKKRGRISTGNYGFNLNWDVEMDQPPVQAYGDGGVIDFSRHDLWQQLVIDVRGYVATDTMTGKEKLMNAGDVAIIKRYDRIMPNLMKSIRDRFGTELYVDGYATGNSQRLIGIESFCGTGTTAAGDRIAQPSDTYAGKSTAVGQFGSWSNALSTYPNAAIASDWPDGQGTASYDYLSPKLLNWSSTNWGTSSTAWEDNCERVIAQAVIWTALTSGASGRVGLFLLSGRLFYGYRNKISAKQRIIIPHKDSDDLGFPDALNQEGAAIHYEFGLDANTGYGFNLDEMELCSWGKELFNSAGPEYSIQTDSWLFKVGFFGNAKFNPKAFCKLYNYA